MKKVLALVMVFMLLFFAVACSKTPNESVTSTTTVAGGEEELIIGWAVPVLNMFNSGLDDYIQAQVKKYPFVTLHTVCAENDAVKQIADIEDLIAKGCQLIMVKAVDASTISNVLKQAQDKGIKIMLVQRTMDTENFDYFVGASMVEVGHMMGNYILSKLPNQGFNYCFLEGAAGGSTNLDIIKGVKEIFDATGRADIIKLDGQNSKDARAETKTITENWITAYGDKIDAVLAVNDESIMGAIQAFNEAGWAPDDVILCGCNATAEVMEYMLDGTADMSFALAPGVFPGLEMAIDILRGNADKYQNWYEIPCFMVTSDNCDLYYDDVKANNAFMVGLLPPDKNPLFDDLENLYPELVPLLTYGK